MKPYHNGTLSIEETGLRYKLMIIEGLVFVLPFFIISYIFYVNNIFFKFSQMFIFALILLIILTGLITLRQIFERFFTMTTLMKQAVNNNEYLVDIQKDTAELHEITFSFNNLMKKYEDTTRELGRRVFELFAIKELTEVAGKSLDIDDLLNLLLEKVMTVTKAQAGSVFMVESEKDRFRVMGSKGLEWGPEKGSYIKIDESLARYVVWEKKPLLVQDIEADSRVRKQNDPKYRPSSFLSMPIFVRGDLLSVVNLSHKETGEVFNSNDQEILSIMINEMGFALENAQLHLRVEEHSQDLQERTVELTKTNDQLQEEITNRKHSEAALKESEELYRDLFENANDMIQSVSPDGGFLQVNKKWQETLGYSKEELDSMNIWDIIHPDSRSHCEKIFQKVFSGETADNVDVVFVSKSGESIPVEGNANCRFENRKPIFTRGIFRDISKRKQAEEKSMNTLQELQETRDMLIQSEKLAAIGQLTAGIAHEILNPINIMSIRLQILNESEDLSEPVKNTLNICKNQLGRISEITSNLGRFSRVPEKRITMSNLKDIVEEVLNMCAPQLKVEDVNKVVQYHPELPLIPLDIDKFQQVILNIISNAVSAMSGQETRMLRITTKPIPSEDSIQVIISDTGQGIDDSHINKIFDHFFTTKDQGKGVGLGLYISYGIIEDHGGKIWAENNEWGGASFFIELPLVKDVST
ncbi:MAG: PAS domain S-box protein [Deltaproteobacteria bacterium]|nr:PAS domain S-box protein [Deltaproteobacteria bacterium]